MKKKITIAALVFGMILFGIIAYHGYEVYTKRVFFGVFPLFAWVAVDQPIVFNHYHHKEVVKLNCAFCHKHAERYRAAGIPNIEVCRACHATDALCKRPQALKVMEYVQAAKEIPWKRMYKLPEHVVFPHWIHVQNQIECSVCHGFTGVKERPLKMVDRNYMAWCMDCHAKRGGSTDCYACHSS